MCAVFFLYTVSLHPDLKTSTQLLNRNQKWYSDPKTTLTPTPLPQNHKNIPSEKNMIFFTQKGISTRTSVRPFFSPRCCLRFRRVWQMVARLFWIHRDRTKVNFGYHPLWSGRSGLNCQKPHVYNKAKHQYKPLILEGGLSDITFKGGCKCRTIV